MTNDADARYAAIARMIDHAVLRPDATTDELREGCRTAMEYRVASICLLPYFVAQAAELLRQWEGGRHGVAVGTTVGFPHGAHATATKVQESRLAAEQGAEELDMVVNRSLVKSGRWDDVATDIRAVVESGHEAGCRVKVIFETAELTADEVMRLCDLCNDIQPDWIKTSTGFASGGASLEAVKLMRQRAGDAVQIKASGGIRTLADVVAYRSAGATRIGTSSTSAILDELRRELAGLDPPGDAAGSHGSAGY